MARMCPGMTRMCPGMARMCPGTARMCPGIARMCPGIARMCHNIPYDVRNRKNLHGKKQKKLLRLKQNNIFHKGTKTTKKELCGLGASCGIL
jgi:hypothetical protein